MVILAPSALSVHFLYPDQNTVNTATQPAILPKFLSGFERKTG